MDMENKTIKVRVNGGYIVATAYSDPLYPGIDIEFVADNDKGLTASRPRVIFEQCIGEDGNDDELRAIVWDNPNSEDYTKEIVF